MFLFNLKYCHSVVFRPASVLLKNLLKVIITNAEMIIINDNEANPTINIESGHQQKFSFNFEHFITRFD